MAVTPNLPTPQSYDQILSDMLSAYASKLGINDFLVGSVNTSFFEVVALATARASGDLFQILRDFSVDRATGEALKRLAQEYGVIPISARPTTGNVNVIDTSFTKIFTKVYAGTLSPNIGSTAINVSDASLFPASGSVYIGRGTPNVEGPIPYIVAPVQSGSYWTITLNAPTAKFHNIGETVILAQGGNRAVPANVIVISPGVGSSPDIQYSTIASYVILDGETEVDNVQVSALTPGASGNVPIGAIKSFATPPFAGATVTNTLPFTSGLDNETDNQLRVRIKNTLASQGLGTATAVKSALIGATPSDENDTIVSDSIVTNTNGSATVYIDDGTGYEAKSAGVGLESIVDSALGGEQFFQLQTGGRQAPVAKAFLQTTSSAPFDLIEGDTLAVVIGGVTYQHVFTDSDFVSPGGATAFEVTASINANTLLAFEATTAGGGIFVVIRAKAETNDGIFVTTPTTSGRNASILLGFPSNVIETLRLYKNDIPLSKDGETASVFTQEQALWSATIQNGDTLILSVDGTSPITYTITDADFINTGLYTSVANTNSLASWVKVFNNKLTGITATIVGQQIDLTSNLGPNNRASVVIGQSSTLVTKGMFSSLLGLSSFGKASDFTLDRNTAQFELVTPLVAKDKLSAGSNHTEATIKSQQISSGSVTLTSNAHIWLLMDTPGQIIPTGVVNNTTLGVSKPSTNVIRYTSNVPSAFSNVQLGDYVIVWSDEVPSTDRLEGRVYAVSSTTLDILITPTEWAAVTVAPVIPFVKGFVVLRSALAPQRFEVTSGISTLDQIAQQLQVQSENIVVSVFLEQYLVVTTTTKDSSGSLLAVTSDTQGEFLQILDGTSDVSKDSLIAFRVTQDFTGDLPLFIHALFASGTSANPPNSFVTSLTSSISLSSFDPNDLICMLHPYGTIRDTQPYGECPQETTVSGATIGIEQDPYIHRVRSVDRFYLGNPLDFGHKDTSVVIVDNNTSNETFEIPFYRKAKTNTGVVSNPYNFNAYDTDSGPTATFTTAFGSFNFANFKVLMQAKKVLKPTPSQTAILYRSTPWGRSGEKITVGYIYPSGPNAAISSSVSVSETVAITISLKSGAASVTSIAASTQWNVTITPNVPSVGISQVTYTWNGVGTNPTLALIGNEYVNISSQSGFSTANTGIFKLSSQVGFTPTATSFSVQRPNGAAVAESNKPTLNNGAIIFYAPSSTTAAQIVTYVNANLSQYVSATLVNDGGISGSGIIVLSTFDDSSFAYSNVQLQDGINWIASSNLAGSPQFTFKNALTLPTDVGYAFNDGEEVRLIPTTMPQVRHFISILAVSGFTTVGTVKLVDRETRLELATDTLGSSGAIQIVGGLANEYGVPVLDSAFRIDNSIMNVSVDQIASQGIHSDQWFRLQAAQSQKKVANFSSSTGITVLGNTPSVGQSTINVSGRTLTQRYFGKPRNNVRVRGRTFRVEKQGSLACISWNGVGSNPAFIKSPLNLNDSGGGTLNVFLISNTNDAQYIILSGNANFTEVSIGDLLTVTGSTKAVNNGTFLVTGVSDNGKTIQVTNPNAQNEFSSGTFTFSANSTAGDAFTVNTTTLIAGTDFTIGGTSQITAANLAATIATLSQLTASANGNVVTVSATVPSGNFALSYAGTPVVTTSGSTLVGASFVVGDFSVTSGVSEGDTVILSSPFTILNQGRFRVIREYNDSIWIENPNVIEEEVALPYNPVTLGFNATTGFKVNANNNSLFLEWNGAGTEPSLGNTTMGDVVTVGNDFAVANRGDFMILRSSPKLQQITQITVPSGAQFTLSGAGKYFETYNAGNANQYYVWYNVNGTNSDPAVGGFTGVQVAILSGDTAALVASKTATAINGSTVGLTAVASGSNVTITTTGSIETNTTVNINVPAPFTVQTLQFGTRTYLEAINPSAVTQASVLVTTSVLEVNRPQMRFWEYESSVPGDLFVSTGNILTTANAGSYPIAQVLNRDSIIVNGNLASVTNVNLGSNSTAVYVEEGVPYSGYKHVFLVSAQPGAPTRNLVVFDTTEQYQKINESAGVEMTSLSKLNFNTTIRSGLDSYRYNTGLIAEANRIVYGDPRDPITYPGVGAAGADIFIREPLALRIQISVDIRLLTGAPFAAVSQQVRTNIAYLVNSNPVGKSIDISSVVSSVRAIPGISSVAINSPQYDSTHDLIFLAPSEKAVIIDPTTDISVNQIGT